MSICFNCKFPEFSLPNKLASSSSHYPYPGPPWGGWSWAPAGPTWPFRVPLCKSASSDQLRLDCSLGTGGKTHMKGWGWTSEGGYNLGVTALAWHGVGLYSSSCFTQNVSFPAFHRERHCSSASKMSFHSLTFYGGLLWITREWMLLVL